MMDICVILSVAPIAAAGGVEMTSVMAVSTLPTRSVVCPTVLWLLLHFPWMTLDCIRMRSSVCVRPVTLSVWGDVKEER